MRISEEGGSADHEGSLLVLAGNGRKLGKKPGWDFKASFVSSSNLIDAGRDKLSRAHIHDVSEQ